jgi:hypothetical protein
VLLFTSERQERLGELIDPKGEAEAEEMRSPSLSCR